MIKTREGQINVVQLDILSWQILQTQCPVHTWSLAFPTPGGCDQNDNDIMIFASPLPLCPWAWRQWNQPDNPDPNKATPGSKTIESGGNSKQAIILPCVPYKNFLSLNTHMKVKQSNSMINQPDPMDEEGWSQPPPSPCWEAPQDSRSHCSVLPSTMKMSMMMNVMVLTTCSHRWWALSVRSQPCLLTESTFSDYIA